MKNYTFFDDYKIFELRGSGGTIKINREENPEVASELSCLILRILSELPKNHCGIEIQFGEYRQNLYIEFQRRGKRLHREYLYNEFCKFYGLQFLKTFFTRLLKITD